MRSAVRRGDTERDHLRKKMNLFDILVLKEPWPDLVTALSNTGPSPPGKESKALAKLSTTLVMTNIAGTCDHKAICRVMPSHVVPNHLRRKTTD